MAFSESGNKLLVTGTETSLDGAQAVSGVSRNEVGDSDFYIYTSTLPLNINGTLTIDPRKEMLIIDSSTKDGINIQTTGRLNVGTETTSGSSATGATAGALYAGGTAIICGVDGDACCSNGGIDNSGTLAVYGATIVSRGLFIFQSGCEVIVRDGTWIFNTPSNNATPRVRCLEGGGIDIIGLTTYNVQFDILTSEQFGNFLGYDGRDVAIPLEGAVNAGGGGDGVLVDIRNLPDYRAFAEAAANNWRGQNKVEILNSAAGSATVCVADGVQSATVANGNAGYGGRIFHEVEFTVTDSDGTGLVGAEIYGQDTDHGTAPTFTLAALQGYARTGRNRGDGDISAGSGVLTYDVTTGTNGQITIDVLTATWYRTNSTGDLSGPDGNELVNIRGNTNTAGTDDFTFHVEMYGYEGRQIDIIANGASALQVPVALEQDAAITETDLTTVMAYTELDTAAKLYDWLRSRKTASGTGNGPSWGGAGNHVVTRTGDTLDFGSLNVTFADPTGTRTATFNAANDTLTINTNAATLSANIRTTGTVTVHANQMIDGSVTDTTGSTSRINVTQPADANGRIAIFASVANSRAVLASSTAAGDDVGVSLTPAQSTSGLAVAFTEPGRDAQMRELDVSAGGTFDIAFARGAQTTRPSGDAMLQTQSAAQLQGISAAFGFTDLTAPTMVITLPNRTIRVQPIYNAVESELTTDDGMKFLVQGGKQIAIDLSPVAGDSLYLNYSGTKLDAAQGESDNCIVQGNVFHPDGAPIVGDGTNPVIAAGVDLDGIVAAVQEGVLNSDIDPDKAGTQSLAALTVSSQGAVTDSDSGLPALKDLIDGVQGSNGSATLTALATAIAAIPTTGGGGGGTGGITLAQLNTARDAIISGLRGTGTTNTLTSLATSVGGIPTTTPDLSALATATNVTDAVAALRGTSTTATLTALAGEIAGLIEPADITGLASAADITAAVAAIRGTDATNSLTALASAIAAKPDLTDEIEDDIDIKQTLQIILAMLIGTYTYDDTTEIAEFRRVDSAATPVRRITLDEDGARTASVAPGG